MEARGSGAQAKRGRDNAGLRASDRTENQCFTEIAPCARGVVNQRGTVVHKAQADTNSADDSDDSPLGSPCCSRLMRS